MSIAELIALVNQGGILPFLLLVIVGALRGWWVPGWMLTEMQEDRNRWMQLALSGTEMAERLTKIVPAPRKRTPREP